MEEHFFEIARFVALAIEAVAVLVLAIATVVAVARLGRMIVAGETTLSIRRDVWLSYGAAIALALEFTLAADIIRSSIAPSWDSIGKLAAIAAIRTLLNVFLMRDLESLGHKKEHPPTPNLPSHE
jgi:uncharacterized membrane protein